MLYLVPDLVKALGSNQEGIYIKFSSDAVFRAQVYIKYFNPM